MKVSSKLAILTATMALGAAPALALGPPSGTTLPSNPGTAHMPTTPGSQGSQGTSAYGKYCQIESKTHVAGTPGTPFSKCVTGLAKLANGSTKNPTTACKSESKTHVAGTPGTPFSLCVSGAAKLLKSQARS